MRMHRADRKNGWNGHAFRAGVAIIQHDVFGPAAHSILSLTLNPVERDFEPVTAVPRHEGNIQRHRLVTQPGVEGGVFGTGHARRVEQQVITLFRRFIQDIAEIAEPGPQRHDMAFTQAVNRRVRDLGEVLAEEMMQAAIACRQDRKRGIIPH